MAITATLRTARREGVATTREVTLELRCQHGHFVFATEVTLLALPTYGHQHTDTCFQQVAVDSLARGSCFIPGCACLDSVRAMVSPRLTATYPRSNN